MKWGDEAETAAKTLTKGEEKAKQIGWPDAEPGYNWTDIGKETPVYKKNPGNLGPQREYDPIKKIFRDKPVKEVKPKTTWQKGEFGERKAHQEMEKLGHQKVGGRGMYGGKQGSLGPPQGIDGIYRNATPPPNWIVIDAKYGTSGYGKTVDGLKQMSDRWIERNLESAVGKEMAQKFRLEGYLKLDAKVSPNGSVLFEKISW